MNGTGNTAWISDGSCDDINNNPFCNFDGDDCCGFDVKRQYCYDCLCLGKYKSLSNGWMNGSYVLLIISKDKWSVFWQCIEIGW